MTVTESAVFALAPDAEIEAKRRVTEASRYSLFIRARLPNERCSRMSGRVPLDGPAAGRGRG